MVDECGKLPEGRVQSVAVLRFTLQWVVLGSGDLFVDDVQYLLDSCLLFFENSIDILEVFFIRIAITDLLFLLGLLSVD